MGTSTKSSVRFIVRVNGCPVIEHHDSTGVVVIDFKPDARPHTFNTEHQAKHIAVLLGGKAFKTTETWEEERC